MSKKVDFKNVEKTMEKHNFLSVVKLKFGWSLIIC
jgi:hypothetical protein